MGGDRVPGFSTISLHAGGSAAAEPVGLLEERIAALEGGTAAVALSSGRAAQLAVLSVLLRPGEELIASERMGEGATAQLKGAAATFGWEIRFADPEEPVSFERAVSPKTKAILASSLADDASVVADLDALGQTAKRAQVPFIVDNTLATPFLTKPLDHGADIVIHSGEMFLGGEAGIVVDGGRFNWMRGRYPIFHEPQPAQEGASLGEAFGNFAFAMACRQVARRDLGAGLTAQGANAILGGLETLALRIERQSNHAQAIAEHLAAHGRIDWVSYPGLAGDRYYNLARRYCPAGAGAVIGLGLAGGSEGADRLLGRTRLIAAAEQLGGVRSVLLRHGGEGSVGLRLFVGLEDLGDLLLDLDEALVE